MSTWGQSLDSQVDALVGAGAVRVFQEYASGGTQARMRWKECLDYLQPGNVLMVADLTRLGREDRVPVPSRAMARYELALMASSLTCSRRLQSTSAHASPNEQRLALRQRKPEAG